MVSIKFTVLIAGNKDGPTVDIEVACDPATRVTELAKAVLESKIFAGVETEWQKLEGLGKLTFFAFSEQETEGEPIVFDPEELVARAGMKSGMLVYIAHEFETSKVRRFIPVAGELVLRDDKNREIRHSVNFGENSLGRGNNNRIILDHKSVSRRHAMLLGTPEGINLYDLGSANGTKVDEDTVRRVLLKDTSSVQIGDVTGYITPFVNSSTRLTKIKKGKAGKELFLRSPVVRPNLTEAEIELLSPPDEENNPSFSVLTLIAPVFMGATLYFFTKSSYALIFLFLGPTMALGSWLEKFISLKRKRRSADRVWQERFAEQKTDLNRMREHEIEKKKKIFAGFEELKTAALEREPPLWAIRRGEEAFLTVSVGKGEGDPLTRVVLPKRNLGSAKKWEELSRLALDHKLLEGVPVLIDFKKDSVIGVVGAAGDAFGIARGIVLSLSIQHNPQDLGVRKTAGRQFDFIKWLPHATEDTPGSGSSRFELTVVDETALTEEELTRLHGFCEGAKSGETGIIWVTKNRKNLPSSCEKIIEFTADGPHMIQVCGAEELAITEPILVDSREADSISRCLSPLSDGNAEKSGANIPQEVSLLSIHPAMPSRGAQQIVENWGLNKQSGLAAVVGSTETQNFEIDLRAEGPHALVGGTTGAGKSEFLQSWLVSLALEKSPARLNFLLIDYKGGAAFAGVSELPHTVGLVTDLTPSLALRVLVSLRAEVRRRETVLNSFGFKDIIDFERANPDEAPPVIIIAVDEFATLTADVPDFVQGIVDIAQRGRSLGLHLILATQRPAGVVTENLRANTNIRIALRVADTVDSVDLIGTKEAASIGSENPGRALAKTGASGGTLFQSAYLGRTASYQERKPKVSIKIIGREGTLEKLSETAVNIARQKAGQTEFQYLLEVVKEATKIAGVKQPRRPWIAPLKDLLPFFEFETEKFTNSLGIAVGTVDKPDKQTQEVARLNLSKAVNVAIYGASGAGKTVFLKTIIGSLTVSKNPCQIFVIDAAGGQLKTLSGLSKVVGFAGLSDEEETQKTFERVLEVISARERQDQTGDQKGVPLEPVIVLIDGFGAFREQNERTVKGNGVLQTLHQVMQRGRAAGVHVILTADRLNAVPGNFSATIQQQIFLRLANKNEHDFAGIKKGQLDDAPPGRGTIDGNEFQVAHLGVEEENKLLSFDRRMASARRNKIAGREKT